MRAAKVELEQLKLQLDQFEMPVTWRARRNFNMAKYPNWNVALAANNRSWRSFKKTA